MADVVYFDGGISIPFCPPTVNGIYISGSGCCSEFYSAFIGGNQTYNLTYTLPTASGTSGQVLTNDGNGNLSWTTVSGGGGGGNPAGTDGMIQYNNGGVFGGSTLLFWDDSTNRLGFNTSSPAQSVDIQGTLRLSNVTGVAETLMGRNSSGDVAGISIGSGLSLSGNTISFTGSTGGGTGTVTGTGTTNYLSKWSSSTALTNSIVLETGSTIDISGALRVTASSGTATAVMGRDANGYVSNLSLGNGLSISGGTLSFTGSTGVSGNFVPYLGATGNTDLGGYGIAGSYFQLSTSTGGTLVPGMFSWNGSDGTADLMLKGGNVTLQIGQEQVARVINETGANLLESEYKVVRVNGSTGTRLKVALALASGDATSVETLGVVTENITLNQEGFVTTSGLVRGINTTGSLQGETWSDGDMLFLSPFVAGGLTNIKPQAPNHLVVMGYVVTAANNGTIYVKVDNGYELDELHNVLISSAATNEILAYDGVTGVWRNRTASSLNLVSGSGVTGIVPRWASSSGLTDSIIFSTGTVVGINTTSPAQTLDIRGTMRLTGSTGVSSNLMGRSVDGDISGIVVDGGLSLSGNILSVTGVTYGTGTTNRLLKWSSATGVTDSIILETGSTIDITGALRVTASSGTSTTLMGRDGNGYVSGITVGSGLSLSGNTLSTTGTTGVSGSGTATQVAFWSGATGTTSTALSGSSNLYWDNVNGRLGVNQSTPLYRLHVGSSTNSAAGTPIGFFGLDQNDNTTIQVSNSTNGTSALAGFYIFGANSQAGYILMGGSSFSDTALRSTLFFETNANTSSGMFFNVRSGDLVFGTSTSRTPRMRVFSSGNVMINNSTHVDNGYKFEVNSIGATTGGLRVTGIGVSTGITADFRSSGGTSLFRVIDNGQIGVNTATPNTSSIFQIDSTTLGFLPPRMSTTNKIGIASPAQGLVVYDTTMQALSAYNGSNWATVGGGEQVFTITGSTATINFNAGNIADITLATSTTLTLTGGTFGTFIIKLTQDATGGRVVSWPSNVRWSGGIPPSLTTTGGKVDVISLIFDGTNYYGTYALNF